MPCKYMRSKYNYTPNDYDFQFNISSVPSNIPMNGTISLSNRVQSAMSLGKKAHFNFNIWKRNYNQKINIRTTLKINENEVEFL